MFLKNSNFAKATFEPKQKKKLLLIKKACITFCVSLFQRPMLGVSYVNLFALSSAYCKLTANNAN